MHAVDIVHEYADAAIARLPLGLSSRKEMQSNFVTAQARIEYWVPDGEAKRVAVMLDALGYATDDKYSCGPYQHRLFFNHPDLPLSL